MEDLDVPMETEDGNLSKADKKYYIDTTKLKVPRKGMEVNTFLKDGMSMYYILLGVALHTT